MHPVVIEYLYMFKPGEGELGTGPGLTPVPLAGPKEQTAPGPRTREPEIGASS